MWDSYTTNPYYLDGESPVLVELRDYASSTVLFYFILFYFILFYFILFYFIYFILFLLYSPCNV